MLQLAGLVGASAANAAVVTLHDTQTVEAGGLMAYAVDDLDTARRLAAYVDRIFKGAKPADLPVAQPTRFELVLDM